MERQKMPEKKSRPYLGVYFKCCRVYARIYLTKDQKAFAGNCPRCAASIRIAVGEGGSAERFWHAE